MDWDGNIVWKFDRTELVADPGKNHSGRQGSITIFKEKVLLQVITHRSRTVCGWRKTLILTHENLYNHEITDVSD